MNDSKIYDVAVVGGGLSGITFAHTVAKHGLEVLLLEKRDVLGGCVHTINPYKDNYFAELGAHTIYSSYAAIIRLINACKLQGEIIPYKSAPYKMYANGHISSMFRHIYPIEGFFSLFNIFTTKKRGLTVAEYYSKLLGKRNFADLIHPATSAVICQNSATFAADLLLKIRKKDKTYPRSFTINGGLGALLNTAANGKNIELHTNADVVGIEKTTNGWDIKTASGAYSTKQLALATEGRVAAELVAPVYQDMAKLLKALPSRASRAFNVSFAANKSNVKHFAYIIAKNASFTAIVSRDMLPDVQYRSATFHFKPDSNPAYDRQTADEVLELKDRDYVTNTAHFELPHLGVSHHEWRRQLDTELVKAHGFYLLGNYFDGLSMEDCALRAENEALRAARAANIHI
ncbi:FAD-dependent oxidoreductase [Deferribacterales bacterium RsTz2092]|nr:FAD-dependent oxidoreductase [Deferribacterales bacterium]